MNYDHARELEQIQRERREELKQDEAQQVNTDGNFLTANRHDDQDAILQDAFENHSPQLNIRR